MFKIHISYSYSYFDGTRVPSSYDPCCFDTSKTSQEMMELPYKSCSFFEHISKQLILPFDIIQTLQIPLPLFHIFSHSLFIDGNSFDMIKAN